MEKMKTKAVFMPIINGIQKIGLYETKSKFYLVGSNNTQTRFKVIKIDRMEPYALQIYDDKVDYTADEIQELTGKIYSGNKQRITNGSSKVISAFGILGFVKFLEGYYIILITKRRKAAMIGMHTLYKIEDTHMIYIPHESVRVIHPDEPRYVKMFQNIDLSSNFYFSYSYDITHTLQHNLTNPQHFAPDIETDETSEDSNTYNLLDITKGSEQNTEIRQYGVRIKPNRKFVWNTHLLKIVEKILHPDWILYITHGFVGQSNINVYGKSLYVTLMARRSCRYAGTRFLKRGANFQGDVANEVETEQVIHDSAVSSFNNGHFTSFVQLRGSIPGHWKQDMGKMVAKPAITIDLHDPFAEIAGAHFNELFVRYGAPIVVLNLVKARERKPQEQLLSEQLNNSIKYLNQFLPTEHQIVYKTFDMARKSKGNANVMNHLGNIARNAVCKTGIFHNQAKYFSQQPSTVVGFLKENGVSLQTGIIRTNCVDCLDRTNTAQFAIGKCVLGYQLCALGVLDSPSLEFDTDCVRMLECLYEDHGDTLALQYGGSQLVHRIKTYRKTAPWTSQGNDIMQTLSRYYSNTFSDAEKQNTINLFLGIFVPQENKPHIWEYANDYYFHCKNNINFMKSLTQWWDNSAVKSLPHPRSHLTKTCFEIIQIHTNQAEMIDAYSDYHRPFEFSVLSEMFAFKISNSIRDFMPNFTLDYSPFSIRVRPVRRREENQGKGIATKNPSVSGQSSTSSAASSTSASGENSSDDESSFYNEMVISTKEEPKSFKKLFPSTEDVYGAVIHSPSKEDVLTYKNYVLVGKKASGTALNTFTPVSFNFKRTSDFCNDSSFKITPPVVKEESRVVYQNYVNSVSCLNFQPSTKDLAMYQKYASYK